MEPILRIENIKKYFERSGSVKGAFQKPERLWAVDGVSLALHKGEVLGLVGESGCGKSTLANIIVRLIREDEGHIIFNGRDITDYRGKALRTVRKDIQIVFQDVYGSLNPSKKIGWLLRESLDINTAMSPAEKEKRVDDVMDMVGLNREYKRRYPRELSGGERQRAGIGIAIMQEPQIIIADEAVSALDVSVQAQILNLMTELKQQLGLSYIFISHDLNVVNYISDTIAVMNAGRIVEMGSAEAIFQNPAQEYTKKLFDSIPIIRYLEHNEDSQ